MVSDGEAVVNIDGREIRFEVGSISHGTLRDEDLIDAFASWLEAVDRKGFREWMEENTDEDGYIVTDEWTLNDLFETLDNYAPEGYYFGAHGGDGSDFGFWEWKD